MKRPLVIFYIVWAIIGLLQAYNMELADDEAYYWVCGQYLDWGSYHTPPLVPFLSKIGHAVLHNELGVRLFYFIAHMLTLFFLEQLTKPKNETLFIVILSSFVILHIAGFWAVPDIPYLLFTVLLIYLFIRYSQKDNFLNSLFLSISLAFILYSKYHGVLIIGALLLANLKLFKRPSLYLIGFGSVLLLAPHIIWLWNHDFISMTFHINDRDRKGYHWYYPLMYLLNVILISGPIIGLFLLPKSVLYKTKNALEKNAKYILVFVLVFFLLLSFRNRIEANWMVVVIIPLTILGYQIAENKQVLRKCIYYTFPLSLMIALATRLFLTFDLLPRDQNAFKKLNEFHGNKERINIIEDRAKDLPVLFQSNHQLPSKYLFYSDNKRAANRTPFVALASQFELLKLENAFHGEKVLLVTEEWTKGYDFKLSDKGFFYFKEIDTFCSYSHLKIKARTPTKRLTAGSTAQFKIEILDFKNIDLSCPTASETYLTYSVAQGNDYPIHEVSSISLSDLERTKGNTILDVKLPSEKGAYRLIISLHAEHLIPTNHHNLIPVLVE